MADQIFQIGITGRRKLPCERLPAIEAAVGAFFERRLKGNSSTIVLSSLAEGADTLCARIALRRGLRLIVPLPLPLGEYLRDFSEEAASEFHRLLSLADDVFEVPPQESAPANPGRGFFYRQAGIYTAKRCDIMLALWDGIKSETPDGAGTYETIKLAEKFMKPVEVIFVN